MVLFYRFIVRSGQLENFHPPCGRGGELGNWREKLDTHQRSGGWVDARLDPHARRDVHFQI